jgi:hypothetical protein
MLFPATLALDGDASTIWFVTACTRNSRLLLRVCDVIQDVTHAGICQGPSVAAKQSRLMFAARSVKHGPSNSTFAVRSETFKVLAFKQAMRSRTRIEVVAQIPSRSCNRTVFFFGAVGRDQHLNSKTAYVQAHSLSLEIF